MHFLRNIFLLFALTSLAFFILTCDDEPTKPPPPPPIDSTSHTFFWRVDTLGAWLSRVNDVFCLSENDAYAAGIFYERDSNGIVIDSLTCNFAHWDGMNWRLEKVNPIFNGMQTFGELYTVYALSPHDVWISPATHWDGNEWKAYDVNKIATGMTRKIWGSRTDDIWFAGEYGSIVHWDGHYFGRRGLPVTAFNLDVWGCGDTVYVAASDYNRESGESGYVIHIEYGSIKKTELLSGEQISVWGMKGAWYTGGCSPLYQKTSTTWKEVRGVEQCIKGIRGTALNNLFIVHQRGKVIHYNGSTFKEILPEDPSGIFFPYGISAVGNAIFFGGSLNSYAIVKRGYMQPIKK